MSRDPLDHSWWLASRTAGVVALVAMSLSVALGLHLAIKGMPRRPGLAAAVRGVHEHLGLVGLVAFGVHAVTLLGDPFLKPGLTGILVPFTLDYRPFWTGLGIIGGLVVLVTGLSAYAKKRLGPKRQKTIHRFTLVGWALAVGHTLGAGTDAGTLWLSAIVGLPALPIVFHGVLRLTNPPKPQPKAKPAA
jgi:sulfoxide reductase heme-binding subunit YedZ